MSKKGKNYWELEKPVEIRGEKSVARVYVEHGRIQAFPVVNGTKYGIGRGATIDLTTMDVEQLKELKQHINEAIDKQISEKEPAFN